ncbi:hypothetical protein P280DRAFT_489333 [Massarina eburnea CBS 473.64]|uniref:Hemerythrin-like domain-containing protein n=1 Tax=Massarina eburnea CBS 473.64 TaxID=1395130 RepID=A0A6A6S702_9PLEO|nr:hypothetical protein P280DRAFT_489333 [Massarina eburnea CBS 473.64]
MPPHHDWETTPIPLIPTPYHLTRAPDQYTSAASDLALLHNTLIRALNSIYIQAPHVPVPQYANFVKYSLAAHAALTAHTRFEQALFSPEPEHAPAEPGLVDATDGEQRRGFVVGVAAWGNWLRSIGERKNNFSGDMCVALMDDFVASVARHFRDGVEMVRVGEKKRVVAARKREIGRFLGGLGKRSVLPVVCLNHDDDFEGGWHGFPPVPAVVRWVWRNFGRLDAEVWGFSCVGFDGKARALRYGGE